MPSRSAEDWRVFFASQVRLPGERWRKLFLDLIDDLALAERETAQAQDCINRLLSTAGAMEKARVLERPQGRFYAKDVSPQDA